MEYEYPGVTLLGGVIMLTAFLVGLQSLAPASSQAAITGRIVEIAPQVSGRVDSVSAKTNAIVEAELVHTGIISISEIQKNSRSEAW